jgi:hypothetical protein
MVFSAPRIRGDRLLPVALVALVVGVALWAAKPYPVGVFHDDGVYVILGKSIATGQGYRFLHLPGAPPATHYPPAYPTLLALLWTIAPHFPENIQTFLFANAVFLGLTALSVDQFARRVLGWPRLAASAAALIATLSAPLIMLSSLVLSEPMFVAVLFPVLIAAERAVDENASAKRIIAVSIALGALALVRTHALAVAIAFMSVLVWRRRWTAATIAAGAICATVGPWHLWLSAHAGTSSPSLAGSYGPYSAWLANGAMSGGPSFVWRTVMLNIREVLALLADHVSLTDDPFVRTGAAALTLAVVFVGAWRSSRRAPVTVGFTVVYVLVLLAWPFTPWRFLYAIWPVVVLFAGETVALVGKQGQRGFLVTGRALCAAVLLLIGAGALREESRAYAQRSWEEPGTSAAAEIGPLVRWVSAQTMPKDIVAVDGEQLVYLFTGRRALPVAPFTAAEYVHPRTAAENAETLRGLLREYPVKYVATISPGNRASADIVSRDSTATSGPRGAVRLVSVSPLVAGKVFRVEPAER